MTARASLASWGLLLAWLALWWLASHGGWVHRAFLPTPEATWASLWSGLRHGELAAQTLATVQRMLVGWLLACAMGVALGTLIGGSASARRWLAPTLEFLRPLPASAVLPLATALFGLSPRMVLVVVMFGALWPVLLATLHGLASVPVALREVARNLQLGAVDTVLKIGLPHALPDILAGMRLSLAVALIVSVVGEMMAAQSGLGQTLLLAARSYRSSELMAGIALLSAVGVASNLLLGRLERTALRWQSA